ncbi:hypothetical protein JRQ81_015512 [Phrynocephalus forsythii]|uniref:EF-hand domain-containing protein n=1 Tax=Phrynocephalus forsythii TaxID=171643 RepID=A0A9Q0XU40_9SAUR|nr:hypothetical protein JRQ81_015512 [Phrynocephalus forsythii]
MAGSQSGTMAHRFTEAELRTIKELFSELDKDGDGAISSQDLATATDSLKPLVPDIGRFFADKMLEELIQEIDTDKDGKVSYDEFVSMLADK